MTALMASPQRTGREPGSTEGLWKDQRGQDMTEYALIGGMVSSIAVAIVPELFAIVQHVGGVLLSVTEACAQYAR
jgi:Flp pilus assembly pilin Flp